jgi:endonuclease III
MDGLLAAAHGTPEAAFGSKSDPLEEAICIILSFQTDLARLRSTWSSLRAPLPSLDLLERATARDVARILRPGVLHRQMAKTIRCLLAEVCRVAGAHSLDLLRSISDEQAERLLVQFPGLSWKAARCVILYSLGRDVLPVDSNTFRILKRTSVLSRSTVYRRRALRDAIQNAVPARRRRTLHVNFVVHGQRTCLPRGPRCDLCLLGDDCPRVGFSPMASRRVRERSVRGGRSVQ